ncbi:hypothetical protein NJ959_06045 [Symplocastrum sp. BBK-W-15]|uniref:Uncharacterized protein n=1 Tax=Limnofasciculus baicalensis BBK-W-15 TaxID=2699891 RepID=A0AAE3KLG2_9CYAN|nr:hypothetical protein [Limnofasciculus baicalensis BBK-W-15]
MGDWLLVVGCWLLVVGCLLLVIPHSPLVVGCYTSPRMRFSSRERKGCRLLFGDVYWLLLK